MNSFRSQARKETKALREMYLAAKLDYQEALYRLDGRADPNHPRHQSFEGLIEKYGYEPVRGGWQPSPEDESPSQPRFNFQRDR